MSRVRSCRPSGPVLDAGHLLVDLREAAGDVRPRVPLDRELTRPLTKELAARLVRDERTDRIRERTGVTRRHGNGCVRVENLTIAWDVRGDGRQTTGKRARENHAEALLPERWRHERL